MGELDNLKDLIVYDQSHLLRFYTGLDLNQKNILENSIQRIDMKKILDMLSYYDSEVNKKKDKDYHITPVPNDTIYGYGYSSHEEIQQYFDHGLKLISNGKIGVVILAGGQGTRLGVECPKGMFDIGLNSKKSLFQLQMETVKRLINLANTSYHTNSASITCFIMTSESTDKITKEFFESHNYFGLDKQNMIFFEQDQLPCVEKGTKRILLKEKNNIAFSPSGNGGFHDCLVNNVMILDEIKNRKLVGLHVYCVDNVLVKVADPSFIGCCHLKGVQCGNKVIERIDPNEPLGVVCMVDNKLKVVEYTEMVSELSARVDPSYGNDKQLLFKFGNICNHYFSTDFLLMIKENNLNDCLPIHFAIKKVPFIDVKTGEKIKPEKPNAIKFEKFIFDIFPYSNNFCLYNVKRSEEFSSLKNERGSNSPATCLHDLLQLHRALAYGSECFISDYDTNELKKFEICPLDYYYNKKHIQNELFN